MDPKSFRTTESLVVWLRVAIKERVNASRKEAGGIFILSQTS